MCVISGPPPCTTIGRRPALRSRLMSLAKLAFSESFTIAAPPYFTTARVLVNSRDVAERLDEQRALEAGAVVGEPVVARDGAVGRRVREARVVGVDLHVVVAERSQPHAVARASPSARRTSIDDVRLAHLRAQRQRVGARRRAVGVDAVALHVHRGAASGRSASLRDPTRAPMAASTRPQLGSAPKMAAFTRLEPATARARSRAIAASGAPGDADLDELRRALAVLGDLARELDAQRLERLDERRELGRALVDERVAGQAVGEREDGVVRAHVAVDGEHVEARLRRRG